MNIKTTAILFDTRSIQRYIFSGNRLKANIGASYLVDQLFIDLLPKALAEVTGQPSTGPDHQQQNTDWSLLKEKSLLGYIGGGNALLLLREGLEESTAKKIVQVFSRMALSDYPGLHTGAAIGTLFLNEKGEYLSENGSIDTTGVDLNNLKKKLKDFQRTVFPVVNIPYTGLTLSCEETGEVANAYDPERDRFVSFEFISKLNAVDKANKQLKEKLIATGILNSAIFDSFSFPLAIDQLGQQETENYFAIVHIDGNNMGSKFASCKTLNSYRHQSLEVSSKTARSFAKLVKKIIDEHNNYEEGNCLKLKSDKGKIQLPIRPIVIGGDDVTFVCAAKLALNYTEHFIRYMLEEGIDTCAGIAILGTSYPFFRGYELSEELCAAAKKASRPETACNKRACWLDFAVLNGEQAPTLEQIREAEYHGSEGNMHFGPWRVAGDPVTDINIKDLQKLKQAIDDFNSKPRNKIKELRRIIPRSRGERRTFTTQLKHLQMSMPEIAGWERYTTDLWADGQTPYIDAIEMMDYFWSREENTDGKTN